MSKSNTIGALILGAAVGVALLEFYKMPQEERDEFVDHLKNRAHDLLDDAEKTVETVKHHFAEIDSKSKSEWVDKLFVLRRLLINLFGVERRVLM